MVDHFRLKAIDEETEFPLDKDMLVVGRDLACDAVINHADISRHHAKIRVHRSGVTVEDLHSTNGTSVNNRKISKETTIRPGDVLKLGTKSFYLLAPRAADATVLAFNLADAVRESNDSFVEEAFPTDNRTSVFQTFPMPAGWLTYEENNKHQSSATDDSEARHVDRLLAKQLSADSKVTAALVMISGNHESKVMPLRTAGDNQTWIIGKDINAHLRFTDVTISSHHAELRYNLGTWRIEDKDSTNGVSVNGEKRRSSLLRDRDQITLGNMSMVFRLLRRS